MPQKRMEKRNSQQKDSLAKHFERPCLAIDVETKMQQLVQSRLRSPLLPRVNQKCKSSRPNNRNHHVPDHHSWRDLLGASLRARRRRLEFVCFAAVWPGTSSKPSSPAGSTGKPWYCSLWLVAPGLYLDLLSSSSASEWYWSWGLRPAAHALQDGIRRSLGWQLHANHHVARRRRMIMKTHSDD